MRKASVSSGVFYITYMVASLIAGCMLLWWWFFLKNTQKFASSKKKSYLCAVKLLRRQYIIN
jgi:hypothetical protein